MQTPGELFVTGAEKLRGGILVLFSDGQSRFYSAPLLLSFLSRAEVLPPPREDPGVPLDPEDPEDVPSGGLPGGAIG